MCNAPTSPSLTIPGISAEVGQVFPVVLAATASPGTNPTSTGLTVVADLAAVGGVDGQALLDDGVAPDAVANDKIFTTSFIVNPSLTVGGGPYSFTLTVSDAQSRSATKSGSLTLTAPAIVYLPHDVQGPGASSPYANATLAVQGVVTARKYNGFFLQTAPGSEDADPMTSEGLFVFTNSAPGPTVQVGRLMRVSGKVQEYIPSADTGSDPLTELTSVSSIFDLGSDDGAGPVHADGRRGVARPARSISSSASRACACSPRR